MAPTYQNYVVAALVDYSTPSTSAEIKKKVVKYRRKFDGSSSSRASSYVSSGIKTLIADGVIARSTASGLATYSLTDKGRRIVWMTGEDDPLRTRASMYAFSKQLMIAQSPIFTTCLKENIKQAEKILNLEANAMKPEASTPIFDTVNDDMDVDEPTITLDTVRTPAKRQRDALAYPSPVSAPRCQSMNTDESVFHDPLPSGENDKLILFHCPASFDSSDPIGELEEEIERLRANHRSLKFQLQKIQSQGHRDRIELDRRVKAAQEQLAFKEGELGNLQRQHAALQTQKDDAVRERDSLLAQVQQIPVMISNYVSGILGSPR